MWGMFLGDHQDTSESTDVCERDCRIIGQLLGVLTRNIQWTDCSGIPNHRLRSSELHFISMLHFLKDVSSGIAPSHFSNMNIASNFLLKGLVQRLLKVRSKGRIHRHSKLRFTKVSPGRTSCWSLVGWTFKLMSHSNQGVNGAVNVQQVPHRVKRPCHVDQRSHERDNYIGR